MNGNSICYLQQKGQRVSKFKFLRTTAMGLLVAMRDDVLLVVFQKHTVLDQIGL